MLAALWRIAAAAAVLIAPHAALAQTANQPQAVVTVLYSFAPDAPANYPNGNRPFGGFIVGNDGNFYGTLYTGSAFSLGAIYRLTPSGGLQLLYSFTGGADGGNPSGPLAKDASGVIYGTTQYGSTAFRITPDGVAGSEHENAPKVQLLTRVCACRDSTTITAARRRISAHLRTGARRCVSAGRGSVAQ
jgi:uncharacterized repeat protein (TIGR03803 family)